VADGFISLRPAIYAAGHGEVRFRDFRYRLSPIKTATIPRTPGPT
jgi:hypothetical protein